MFGTNFNNISRRSLIKGLGAAGLMSVVAPVLTGCAPDAASSGTSANADATPVSAVAHNANPPYSYLDDNGEVGGYEVDVLKACAEKLDNYSFTFDGMEFDAMITACESGSADVVTGCLVPSEERKEKFLFCEEPMCLCPLVFAVADDNLKTLEDMAGKTILIESGFYEYGMLKTYNEKNPDKALVLQPVQSITYADAFKMVATGQVDGYTAYLDTFDSVNEEAGTSLSKTDVVFCENTYFMFNKDQEELCNAINGALVELKEDGTLEELATEYLGCDVFTEYADVITDSDIING